MKNILSLILAVPAFLLVLTLIPVQVSAQRGAAAGILLTVNQTGDSADAAPGDNICADAAGGCTLRAAIEESNARAGADVINFKLLAGSVITLTRGELVLTDTVSIVGTGVRRLTVERSSASGTPNFRIFNIRTGPTGFTLIRDLKIRKGIAPAGSNGGGINIETVGNVSLTAVAVSENSADAGGGIANSGILSITRSVINGNMAAGTGGGVLITANPYDTVISNTTITGNTAATGGGIDNSGVLNLANVTLAQNAATGAAASLRSNAAGSVYTVNTIFSDDSTTPNGSVTGALNSLGNNIITNVAGSTGLTNGVNGEKQYTVIRQFGNYKYSNYIPGTVYLEEIKSKRAGRSRTSVLAFDDLGIFNLKEAKGNYELQTTNDEPGKGPGYVLRAVK